jgi:hypothetical protein
MNFSAPKGRVWERRDHHFVSAFNPLTSPAKRYVSAETSYNMSMPQVVAPGTLRSAQRNDDDRIPTSIVIHTDLTKSQVQSDL